MKMTSGVELKLDFNGAKKQVDNASRLAMRDTVVLVNNDAVKDSRKITGHNARSIAGEVSGMGTVAEGADAETERVVDDSKVEGAVYSTSGYGGYLETGTVKMGGIPYIKPAMDKHFTKEKFTKAVKEHLG